MSVKNEIWEDADLGGFYEGLYEVSNWGRWKIKPRIVNSVFGKRKHIQKDRITNGTDSNGYRRVQMKKDGVRRQVDLHIIVATVFVPNPENLPYVLHRDDIRWHNHHSNLEWGTQKENVRQCHERNRHWTTKGNERGNAKLTEDNVRQIRELYGAGKTSFRKLAKMFSVSYSNIEDIIKFKRWKHVQ